MKKSDVGIILQHQLDIFLMNEAYMVGNSEFGKFLFAPITLHTDELTVK